MLKRSIEKNIKKNKKSEQTFPPCDKASKEKALGGVHCRGEKYMGNNKILKSRREVCIRSGPSSRQEQRHDHEQSARADGGITVAVCSFH